jgi:iron complex outermembrane receptor protein
MKKILVGVPLILAPAAAVYAADSDSRMEKEQTMVVTAAPDRGLSPLTAPGAVSVDYGDDLRQARPQVNLSEGLSDVPGLQIQNRQNYAQDLQLSLRGFGSRSTFGVRGIRIYQDGIPSTMPDGQSQISNVDLSSVESIEVLRGPFSALYGNASGGVINITTERGRQPTTLSTSNYYGSYGSWRSGVRLSGATGEGDAPGDLNYDLTTSRFSTHGFRDHSSAHRDLTNAKLGVNIDDRSSLTLSFNSVNIKANDPGGLTREEWRSDSHQAPRAEQYNTRKTVSQSQLGLRYQRAVTDNDDFSMTAWAGMRETVQYQSIPYFVQQRSRQHAGGVIDLTRHYQGIDTRWTHRMTEGPLPVSFTAGIDYETMTEQRRGYENFIYSNGHYILGEKGDLRRKERNLMWNVDPYLQTSWQLTERLTLDAGVRYSSIWFDSNDHYVVPGNGDDSGEASYHKWLPAAALKYDLTDAWNVYTSVGRGYETPTINELSYRNDGQSGLNFKLKPSTSNTVEVGSKMRVGNGLISAALFETNTSDEIVVASSNNGRTSYQNAGKTRRRGVELAWDQQFMDSWRTKLAWTLLDATYREDAGANIKSGNRMPGIARNSLYASLGWLPEQGWYAGGEVRYLSRIQANDANSASAPGYTTVGLNTGYKFVKDNWLLDVWGRVDNLFDRDYVGSVIVNESNGRYFEPAPGRNYGVGMTLSYRFE